MLRDFAGILQTDGYVARDKVGATGMVRARRWAHARRGVFEASKLNPKDTVAVEMVDHLDALSAIDREVRGWPEPRQTTRVAAILGIVATRGRIGWPMHEYLLDVLLGMADRKHQEAATPTPSCSIAA